MIYVYHFVPSKSNLWIYFPFMRVEYEFDGVKLSPGKAEIFESPEKSYLSFPPYLDWKQRGEGIDLMNNLSLALKAKSAIGKHVVSFEEYGTPDVVTVLVSTRIKYEEMYAEDDDGKEVSKSSSFAKKIFYTDKKVLRRIAREGKYVRPGKIKPDSFIKYF